MACENSRVDAGGLEGLGALAGDLRSPENGGSMSNAGGNLVTSGGEQKKIGRRTFRLTAGKANLLSNEKKTVAQM